MTRHINPNAAGELHMERRIIRVDGLPDQAGIAAALRRAFAAGRADECDRDFGELLDRLQ